MININVIQIRNLKQALNHGLVFKIVNRAIKFSWNAWLKPYIDINTDLRKKAKKKDFEKDFFKLMNNTVFDKAMENMRKHRNIQLAIEKQNCVVGIQTASLSM